MSESTNQSPAKVELTFQNSAQSPRQIALISLGRADERAVVLNGDRLLSFEKALEEVACKDIVGLVIHSPSLDSFCLGADIELIGSVVDPKEGSRLAAAGQRIFNLLEDLKCTTVAAISGPCVGGGCELALACDYRIISEHPASGIGLPETKLGILPGFGGSYRLPRLVGVPKALDIILAGKILKSTQALKARLVDLVTPTEKLIQTAISIANTERKITRKPLGLSERILSFTSLGRTVAHSSARKALLKQTKGFYPAPELALDITVSGMALNREKGMHAEAQALGKLIVTPQSKSLVNLYFLTEASKALGKSQKEFASDLYALVVGAGTMGAGIALSLARSGVQVLVKDTSEEALERGKAQIKSALGKIRYLSSYERASIASRIDWITHTSPTEARVTLVIEAVFESIDLKKKIFSGLAPRIQTDGILASNTSSLSLTEIARDIPNPHRVIGMHFFNPVDKMPLVEVIRGLESDDAAVAKVCAVATRLGKFPIVVKDVPGFLVNRILVPYLNEATKLLSEGYSVTEIDKAALAYGMPMGPIRLLDEVGLDVAAHVSVIMLNGYGERMKAEPFAEKLIALDRKGKKNGRGFYSYDGKKSEVWNGLQDALQLPSRPANPLTEEQLTQRLIFKLKDEAQLCLQEGVAGDNQEEAIKQINLGLVMGIGFPPWRGGVL